MADGCPYTLNGPEDGMAKRANGEGSIFRRKDSTWSAELSYWDDYGALKRRTWDGCAFNQAGNLLGESVQSRRRAAQVFDTTPGVVSHFISVWDQLPGSNEGCTQLLRDAIEEVGLFTDPEPARTRALAGSVWSFF